MLAALLVLAVAPPSARAGDMRADERSAGSDLATARTIAAALLARPRAAQLLRV
ncbi:MAG: hypothetical protein JO103_06685, partial [Candidatus Eremiobacteraeota bacterium]|nr:hypothetical protein [Candidatus Eremiobacteraeota bacterium]